MSAIKITRRRVFLQCPQRGQGGWELSFSHREIIYLPLTISLFPNYSTTVGVSGDSGASLPRVTDRSLQGAQKGQQARHQSSVFRWPFRWQSGF